MKDDYIKNVLLKKQNFTEQELIEKAKIICKDINEDFIKRLTEFLYDLETDRFDYLTPDKKQLVKMMSLKNGFGLYEDFIEEKTHRPWAYEQTKKMWHLQKLLNNICHCENRNFFEEIFFTYIYSPKRSKYKYNIL